MLNIYIADVVKHPFMLKENTSGGYCKGGQNLAEVSIDSGRGTMSTGMITQTSRMSTTQSRTRPMPAIHPLGSKIPEAQENSVRENDRSAEGFYSGSSSGRHRGSGKDLAQPPQSSPMVRHPPSPPVRLRDR